MASLHRSLKPLIYTVAHGERLTMETRHRRRRRISNCGSWHALSHSGGKCETGKDWRGVHVPNQKPKSPRETSGC